MGRNTSIKTTTTDNFTQLVNNMNNQSLDVGATGKLTTTVDSDIVGAINELDSNMGAKTSLTTTNKTSIVNAINELDSDLGELSTIDNTIRDSNFAVSLNRMNLKFLAGTGNLSGLDSVGNDSDTLLGGFNDSSERFSISTALNTLSQDIQKLDSNVNREARMTTTATTVRGAINELDSDIGARPHTSLNTTAKNLVGAINENKASLNALAVFRNVATDSGSGSISVTVDSANDTLSILSGGSLKTTGFSNTIQIDHDVTGASSVNNSGNTFIQDLTIDAHGHVTGTASAAAPLPNNLDNSNISSSAAIEFSKMEDLTTSRALVSDGNGDVSASAVTSTEIGYLDGVTSAVQTQLNSLSSSISSNDTDISNLNSNKLDTTGTFLGVINTGQRFVVNGWYQSNDGYNRFYFGNNNHNYYQTRSQHIFRDASGNDRFIIDASGNGYFDGNVTAYYSDERLKDKQGKIKNALDKVGQIETFYFTENELAKSLGHTVDKKQVGVSAQSVKAVLPEIVDLAPFDTDFETGESKSGEDYMTVDYEKLTPLLIEAIKELSEEIKTLKEKD